MSNPELFHDKDDKEELSKFEVLKSLTLKFQAEKHDSISSSSEFHSQYDKKDAKQHVSIIVLSKQSDSEASISSTCEQHKVEGDEEDDGFRTPTCLDHKIPVPKQCPPAPKKSKSYLKRKASQSSCSCSHPLDMLKEVELLFPTQDNPFSDSCRSTKKVRIGEPK